MFFEIIDTCARCRHGAGTAIRRAVHLRAQPPRRRAATSSLVRRSPMLDSRTCGSRTIRDEISEISNFRKFEFAPAMALERPWRCGPGLVAALVLCVPAAQPTQVPAKVCPAFLDAAPLPHTAVAAAAARRAATRVTMKKRQREQAKPLPVANVPQGAARPRLVVFDLDNTLWTPVGGRGGRDAKCMGGVSRG